MRNDLQGIPRYFAPPEDVVNLANNENYNSRYHTLLENELTEELKNAPFLQYGPAIQERLIKKYSEYTNIPDNQIMSAPGSDSLLAVLISALTTKAILVLEQDFFRYKQAAVILSRDVVSVKNNENQYQEIIKQCNQEDVELVFLSNPNNPLGIRHDKTELLNILENTDCYVVIDEAYCEYQDESMLDLIDKYDKLIILRTMSKAWGLAGLRVGFALSNPKLIDYLLAIQGPFTLSSLNANIAAKVLERPEIMLEDVSKTLVEKEKLIEFLNNYKTVKVYESRTNFVYIEVENASEIKEQLQINERIAVAGFPNNGLRITVGTKEQMATLYKGLERYLKG